MSANNHASPAAVSYAQALLDLASEQNQAEPIGADLSAIAEAIAGNPTFKEFLADPALAESERFEALKKSVSGASPLLVNFLGVVSSKRRLSLLPEIALAYRQLLDKKLNKIDVEVTVAKELSDDQLNNVASKVGQALGKHATVKQKVDDSIIGGLILKIEDQLIDASVKSQLEAMKQQLLTAQA